MAEVVNTEIEPHTAKRRRIDGPGHEESQLLLRSADSVAYQNSHLYSGAKVNDNASAHFGDAYHNHYYPRPEPTSDNFELLLKSLLFDRFDARLRNIRTALAQTCTWLFEHEKFLAWQDDSEILEHHGFFWIKGKPGCGKSTIMKLAFEQTKKKRSKGVVISYFFNARAPGALEKSSLGLYRSLTHQIVKAVPTTHHAFQDQFGSKEKDGVVEDWTIEELQEFILESITTLDIPQIQIFVDALDEGEEDDIRQMVSFLEELAQHALDSDVKLRICLSSRHYPYISISHGVEMIVEDQPQHEKDVQRYITQWLRDDNSEKMQELRDEISRKAAGIFLWLILVVPTLKVMFDKGDDVHAVSTHLESLPGKLDDLFADILVKNLESIDTCVILLQWVLCSARPLSVNELHEAVWYSQEHAHGAGFPKYTNTQRTDLFLRDRSRGLVELTDSEPPTVQFIHETVRGFLLSEIGLARIQQQLADNVLGRSHDMLGRTCFTLIQKFGTTTNPHHLILEAHSRMTPNGKLRKVDKVLQANLKREFAMLCYAVENLLYHADVAQSQGYCQDDIIQSFRQRPESWRILHNCLARYASQSYTGKVRLSYIIADKNYISLAQAILPYSSMHERTSERHGTPFQAAVANGHANMASLLLKQRAYMTGDALENALTTAVHKQHIQIVTTLLMNGAKIPSRLKGRGESECNCNNNLLTTASYNTCGRDTFLCAAVHKGNMALVRILVQHGADKDEVGCIGTPLYVSVYFHQTEISRFLMQVATDSFVHVKGRPSILKLAVERGSTDLVRALLAQGHHFNLIDNSNGSILGTAISRRLDQDVIKLLLDRGADVNAQSENHLTPLHEALYAASKEIAILLLEYGADVNTEGGHYRNALQAAVAVLPYRGSTAVARLLLDHGADVNAHGGHFETSLIAAVYASDEDCVRLLLDRGADINFCTTNRGTALDAAFCAGNKGAGRLLLKRGGRSTGVPQHHGTGNCLWGELCRWSINREKILLWGK